MAEGVDWSVTLCALSFSFSLSLSLSLSLCALSTANGAVTVWLNTESVMLEFEDLDGVELDDDDHLELDIANSGTALPPTLKGTAEELVCRVLSELSGHGIDRHDKVLFQCVDRESKRRVYFIEPNVRNNKCQLFPLRSGLFLAPKPLRFVAEHRIAHFEFVRKAPGLRYGEMDIVLRSEHKEEGAAAEAEAVSTGNAELDKAAQRERRKRRRQNTIKLEMIPNAEMSALEAYFQRMRPRIECKKEGQPSPHRERGRGRTASIRTAPTAESEAKDEEAESGGDGDGDDEHSDGGMSSDDEEYDPDGDAADHALSDSDDDELGDDDDDDDDDGASSTAMEDEEDVDLHELR